MPTQDHPDFVKLDRLDQLATRMDSFARIPGTQIRVGLDSILGLVPGVGDALALAPAAYILTHAHRMGAPKPMLVRMAVNTGIDTLIGAIPLIGDIFDIGFKANKRNVALLRKHVENKMVPTPSGDEGHLSSHHPQVPRS